MSNQPEEIDLTDPQYIAELTPEQIAAAGERKKYMDDAIYYFRTTAVKVNYTKPRLKNGELNADAKATLWLELELTPIKKDGSISTKLQPVKFVRVFLYDRLTKQAMERVGYTPEQVAKVLGMTMPETFEGFRAFAKAMFPDRFGHYAKFDKDSATWSYNGNIITEAQAHDIKNAEKAKVAAFQRELRGNPKLVQGLQAFWRTSYEEQERNGVKTKSPWVSAKWPSATPHKTKEGVVLPVADPDKDFA